MAKSDITAAKKAPFVRFVKREGMKKRTVALYYICAVAAALLIGAVILACIGVNVFDYFGKMLTVGIAGSALPQNADRKLFKQFRTLGDHHDRAFACV